MSATARAFRLIAETHASHAENAQTPNDSRLELQRESLLSALSGSALLAADGADHYPRFVFGIFRNRVKQTAMRKNTLKCAKRFTLR
jgi:hypothetical protein